MDRASSWPIQMAPYLAYDRKGSQIWSAQTQGTGPKLADAPREAYGWPKDRAACCCWTEGSEVHRTPLENAALGHRRSMQRGAACRSAGPALYREPQTLAVTSKYGAKPVGRWEPAGTAREAFGRKFYAIEKPVTSPPRE